MHLITCYGWTWEYIDDHVTLPRLAAINNYQSKNPPLHFLVRALIKYHPVSSDIPNQTTAVKPKTKETLNDLVRDFAAAGGIVKGK